MPLFLLAFSICILSGFLVTSTAAQSASSDVKVLAESSNTNREPAFEVASIRPSKPMGDLFFGETVSGFRAENTPLFWLILDAYLPLPVADWRSDRLEGGPDWIRNEAFDVQAKVPDDIAKTFASMSDDEREKQLKPMLRSMLVDRCRLSVHLVQSEAPVLALISRTHGPKLHERAAGTPVPGGIAISDGGVMRPSSAEGVRTLEFYNTSMTAFAEALSGLESGSNPPIQDQTQLTGKFDFILKRKESDQSLESSPGSPSTPNPGTVWDAEALGLGLRYTKARLPALVVDHIERPSEN